MRPHPTHEVLLVDPDAEVRAYRMLFLQMHGFRIASARAFDDTLRHLRAGFRPCIVLADPRAPGAAGWEIVDVLRADSVLSSVPLLLIARDPTQVKVAHWHGVRECLGHAEAPGALVTAIDRQCRRHRAQRRRQEIARRIDAQTQPAPTLLRRPA